MLKQTAAFFSLFAFILWILPLGSFIKPSDEKTACGGSRAFHMCSMKLVKVVHSCCAAKTQRVSFSNAPSSSASEKSVTGSAGMDMLLSSYKMDHSDPTQRLLERHHFIYQQPFLSLVLKPS